MNSHPPLLSAGQMLIFEGDSLTRRSMPPSADDWPLLRLNRWDHSYAEIAEEWLFANLPHLQLKARHCAIGGSSVFELHQRYEAQVKPHRPAWIIFTLGTNDCNRQIPLDVFRSELSRYVATAQADCNTRFLYAGGFEVMPGLSADDHSRADAASAYYAVAREIVRESGGLAPEIGRAFRERAELHYAASSFHGFYGDGTHLNALGNEVLAGLVLQVLRAYECLQAIL